MKQLRFVFACLALSVSWQAQAAMEDDPLLGALFVQQLEQRQGGECPGLDRQGPQ